MRVVRPLAGAALWLLGVAVVAGVGCFAVDSTGHQLGDPEAALEVTPAAGAASSLPSSPPTAGVPGRTAVPVAARPSRTASRAAGSAGRSSPRSSARSSSVLSARSSAQPTPAAPTSSPPVPGRSVPAPSPAGTAPASPPPSPATDTFSSDAGTLTVACAGSTPTAVSVEPAPTWTASVYQDADVVDALFSSDSGRVLDVRATCPDGFPVFATS